MSTVIATQKSIQASPARAHVIPRLGSPYWTSMGLAIAATAGAGLTFFVPGVLNGTAVMNGSARGTALIALVVALPVLLGSMFLVARGGARPVISWLGAAAFLQYNAVLFLLATPFNSLFLLYVAMFALAFWTLVVLLKAIDVPAFAHRFAPELPARALAAYVAVIATLNAAAWLAAIIPDLFSRSPSFLAGTGLTTNPIYVQDLSFWIPLMGVSAVLLWRRLPWGYVLAGGLLVFFFIESISVALDQWMGGTADPTSTVASVAFMPAFAALAVVGLVPLFLYFKHLSPRSTHRAQVRRPSSSRPGARMLVQGGVQDE